MNGLVVRAATVNRIMCVQKMAPPFRLSNRVTNVPPDCYTQRINPSNALGWIKVAPDQDVWVSSRSQQGDLRLSGPPLGQVTSGGPRARNESVSGGLRASALSAVPRT
ncbi:hypothetical protein PoB_007611200 [Plakobranchus ocellatus]|uniref:Uncharacterized protein n=1 Tax=Plakobranchus ocellatus TaxID=259542 RepID=A0AAV4DZ30_9GAST|nr:hypothetical protein PoB_007611200 [Plakobranchus ocellatus]